MKNVVFIQSSAARRIGAKISAHSFKRASARPDSFNVRIIDVGEFPRLGAGGQTIRRGKEIRDWDPDDLQSFTPLRFAPPKLMGWNGRALITDPDCFALGDVADLFDRDMGGKAIIFEQGPERPVLDPMSHRRSVGGKAGAAL